MKVFIGNNLVRVCGILLRCFEFKGKWRTVMVLGKIFCWLGIDWLEAIPCPGVQLRVPVKDRAGLLMWAGSYEPKLTRLFTKLVRPGWVVLDGGAHFGWFTVLFSKLVGPSGRVYAFEPDPQNFALLTQNISRLPNVIAQPVALWDTRGRKTFYRTPKEGESGWGSCLPNGNIRELLEVTTITIDEFVSTEKLVRVDLIKLDVEGAEGRCLSGAKSTLQVFRPIIVLEANPICLARDGLTTVDLVNRLQAHDYQVGWLQSDTIIACPKERNDFKNQLKRIFK
jgi:FkbM family methyltransferase